MCMSDDEQTTSTCFDTESSTGESSAEIQGAAPAATAATATNKICPRCMMFWIIVGVIAIGSILYFGRK
jgi:hypothetical protein